MDVEARDVLTARELSVLTERVREMFPDRSRPVVTAVKHSVVFQDYHNIQTEYNTWKAL